MTVFIILLFIASFLTLYRIAKGPTPADRTVGIDILGTILVGFSAFLTIITENDWYLIIGMLWALLSFVGTLALAKFLEGKRLDD